MPKIKTHKGAAKRLKVTGTGKIRRYRTNSGHLFLTKTAKRKRRLRRSTLADPTNVKKLNRLIQN